MSLKNGWIERTAAYARRLCLAVPFVVVVAAPAVSSWHGLVAAGRDWFGLGAWAPLVPLTLDAAALYVAVLAWQATLAGDSAGVDRFLVWVYAGLSAGINISHADAVGGVPAAVFYGVASLSAALVWERTLRAMRRAELRKLGAIDAPAPRYRLLRWVLHREETWGAFRLAVGEGVTDGRDALALYRGADVATEAPEAASELGEAPSRRVTRTRHVPGEPDVAAELAPEFGSLTQRQALEIAVRELGPELDLRTHSFCPQAASASSESSGPAEDAAGQLAEPVEKPAGPAEVQPVAAPQADSASSEPSGPLQDAAGQFRPARPAERMHLVAHETKPSPPARSASSSPSTRVTEGPVRQSSEAITDEYAIAVIRRLDAQAADGHASRRTIQNELECGASRATRLAALARSVNDAPDQAAVPARQSA